MAQKTTKRKFNLNIDEEKDIFLSSLNKKIRNARKKLEQIEDLEKKDRSTLKPEQLEKIRSRAETLESIKYNDSIKDLYYGALKAAQDEGRALPQQESQVPRKATTEEDKTEVEQPAAVEEPKQQVAVEPVRTQEDNSRIIRETLSKVLNLVHFAQLFRDQSSVQAFRQAYDAHRDQFALESLPDFESFHEFFVKVFTFSESDRFGKVSDKINGSLGELESYINGAEQPALRNKTYRHLQNVVESVARSAFFRDRNAEVEAPKARTHTEPSAIGSELRKAPEHVEAPVVRSPEKETRAQPEAATRTAEKAAPQEEARKDWGAVEDDEEEEVRQEEVRGEAEEEEEQQPAKKEEQKADDGWNTIQPKSKGQKEETGYRGSGTRPYRGGRGGNRGGERGGYRREGQEGQEGGYRPRPRREEGQEGGEGQGEGQGEGRRGGYRGRGEGRGGYRGGYRGRGEGRGGYRGGNRREGEQREQQGERQAGNEGVRTENA